METHIPPDIYQSIEADIASEQSVVGIDAKKTHIYIIYLLKELQEQVTRLEDRISQLEEKIQDS